MNADAAATLGREAWRTGRLLAERRPRTPGSVVLAYHDVVDDTTPPGDYAVTAGQLHRQLTTALRLGLRPVGLGELAAQAAAGTVADGQFAVVFDDALVGVHRHAAATLAELRVPATIFPVVDAVGVQPPWWPGSQRTMTRRELASVVAAGLAIGSHTRTHPSLPGLSAAELHREVASSRAELEDLAQREVDLFAYPYGHHDPAVREAVREAGFRAAFTFLNGRITGTEHPLRLPRLTMTQQHGTLRLAYHLARSARSWPDHQLDAVTHRTS